MKKQIISTAIAAALCLGGISAFAEVTPRVIVDGSEITFDDQKPIIENDRTLIPIRGVMEAAGAKVGWYPKSMKVQIQSHDYWRLAELTINSDVMKAAKFKEDLMSTDVTEVKLDVPAKIVNDRTLIPLRAVNDAFLYDTKWDDETKTAIVTTDRKLPKEGEAPSVYLTTSTDDVKADETFDVFVNVKDFKNEDGAVINGATLGLIYDKSKLELVGGDLYNGETALNGLGASNDNFSEDSLKMATVTVNYADCLATDGVFYKVTFRALSDEGGSVAISNRYHSRLQYDTAILVSVDMEGENMTPLEWYFDTNPVTVK